MKIILLGKATAKMRRIAKALTRRKNSVATARPTEVERLVREMHHVHLRQYDAVVIMHRSPRAKRRLGLAMLDTVRADMLLEHIPVLVYSRREDEKFKKAVSNKRGVHVPQSGGLLGLEKELKKFAPPEEKSAGAGQ